MGQLESRSACGWKVCGCLCRTVLLQLGVGFRGPGSGPNPAEAVALHPSKVHWTLLRGTRTWTNCWEVGGNDEGEKDYAEGAAKKNGSGIKGVGRSMRCRSCSALGALCSDAKVDTAISQ